MREMSSFFYVAIMQGWEFTSIQSAEKPQRKSEFPIDIETYVIFAVAPLNLCTIFHSFLQTIAGAAKVHF